MTYQGSKARYAKYINPILQQCIDNNNIKTFLDPFVGGANIIKGINCEERIGADIDENLIALWQELQKPDFKFPPFPPTREDWDRCKNGEEERKWFIGFVSIFSSNLACGFPAGYDKLALRYQGRINTCKKDLPFIKDINFIHSDYKELTSQYNNCCIYCDPPYENTHRYNYKKFNHEDFWNYIRELSKNNFVFISEQTAPDDFVSIWEKDITNTLRNRQRTAVEKLFICSQGLANQWYQEKYIK